MQRLKPRKTPILIFSVLLILGIIFGIRFFTSASKPQPSLLRKTQPLSELSAQFTTSKLGKIQLPTIVVSSQLNGTITNIPFSTGQDIKGGQPLLQLSDQLGLYTAPLEASKLLLDSTQSLYDKTLADFSTAEKKAELDITELQLQLKQTELDLQEILNQQQTTTLTTTPSTDDPTNSVSPWQGGGRSGATEGGLNNPQPEASTESSTAQETLPDQKSIDQSLVLLKQSLLQSLSDTEQRLEKAKLDYELLKTTHATQLSNLEHSLQTARNEYETAYTTYNKLTIRAPLAGTIADILVSAGDTVREGTPLFTLLPNAAVPSIQVQLSFEEYLTVLTATDVDIILPITTVDTVLPITTVGTGLALSENNTKQTTENNITEKTITGKITSRSPTTNEEGNYTLSIETSNEPLPLSEIIEIQFPIKTSWYYLPSSVVDSINQKSGFLHLLVDNQVQKFPVDLGHQRNTFVEITTPLNPATQIITNRA